MSLNKKQLVSSFPTDISGKWMRIEDVEALVDLTLSECQGACTTAYINSNDSKLREEGIDMVREEIWKMRFQ